jgi:hypothetical protein
MTRRAHARQFRNRLVKTEKRHFGCRHLLEAKASRFFFDRHEDNPLADAWCEHCERLKNENGGQWTEGLTKAADIQLVCEDCYNAIKNRYLRYERS